MICQTSGDACVVNSAAAASRRDHPAAVLTACILASSLAFVDGSVVNVGLPAIGRSLNAGADLQWIINAYLLPLSALMLLGGAVGDRFGRRTVLISGVALFAAGSALCAAAPGFAWLAIARGGQGVGAAFLLPSSLAILGSAFEGEARGRAVGTWSAASAIAGALGPVLGGWLIDTVGWRAIFLINLPLAAAAIALAFVYIREPPREAQGTPLDLMGALLATISLAALTWGLTTRFGTFGLDGFGCDNLVAGRCAVRSFPRGRAAARRWRYDAARAVRLCALRGSDRVDASSLWRARGFSGAGALFAYSGRRLFRDSKRARRCFLFRFSSPQHRARWAGLPSASVRVSR